MPIEINLQPHWRHLSLHLTRLLLRNYLSKSSTLFRTSVTGNRASRSGWQKKRKKHFQPQLNKKCQKIRTFTPTPAIWSIKSTTTPNLLPPAEQCKQTYFENTPTPFVAAMWVYVDFLPLLVFPCWLGFFFFLSLLCLLINCNFSNTMFNFRFLVVFKNLRVLLVFPLLHFTILVPLFSYANSIVCTSSCCFPVYFFFLFWVNLWVFASDLNQDLMICECGCVRSVCYGLVHALNRQKGVYPLNKWL